MNISNATTEPSRKKRATKPSYKMMIIAAITSQGNSRPGLSRQEIASYLQHNYPVSTGSLFDSTLRSALKSGINAGIFVFDESNQRFNLNEEQTSQRKQGMNRKNKTSRKRRRNESKQANESQTFKFNFNFNIVLNEGAANNPSEYGVGAIGFKKPGDDSKASEIFESTLNARADNKDENNVLYSSLCAQQSMETDAILEMKGSQLALLELVESSERQSDLFGVLSYCALKDLQKICVDTISKMDENNARNVHHNVFPINVVIPEDIIRHVLSFDNVNHHRTVCQQWNRLNQQNEEKMLRDMYQSVDDRNIEPLDSCLSTVILHPTRPRLHPIEIQRGYAIVVSSLNQVPADARVLVHPGSYLDDSGICFRKNGQYIGIASNCHIGLKSTPILGGLLSAFGIEDTKQHFHNIKIKISEPLVLSNPNVILFDKCSFEFHNEASLGIDTSDISPVVFNQCTFEMCHWTGMVIFGSADVIGCHFSNVAAISNERYAPGIMIGSLSGDARDRIARFVRSNRKKVSISSCTFSNFSHSVILGRPSDSYRLVEITNNRFHNTSHVHVVARGAWKTCLLQGNSSTGGCPSGSRGDTNKIFVKISRAESL